MLLIITSTSDGIFRFINIDDLEPPKEGFLMIFFAIFDCSAHFSDGLRRNGWR